MHLSSLNPRIEKVQYAVRGELAVRSEAIAEDIKKDANSHPFSAVVACNIGNPQQLNQKPITFFRQVAALTEYPDLLAPENRPTTSKLFPEDAITRAETLLRDMGAPSIGAYTHSQGILSIRRTVADFIRRRDGDAFPTPDPNNIFLTTGASSGVQTVLGFLIGHPDVGVMIPIPQYPLYSATLSLYGGKGVPYFLNEKEDWGMSVVELTESIAAARAKGTDVRALVVINPGNPTGQCLSRENMQEIIRFCHDERLVLLADEVYQVNVYDPDQKPFHSFRKILLEMGEEFSDLELFSFHSTSKGVVGECGRRGGYLECTHIDSQVMAQLYKISSVSLCPNVPGQLMVDLMTNPPRPGDVSYPQYEKETKGIFDSLKRRSTMLSDAFNNMEGVTCNPAEGAMYVFPRICFPKKAIKAAEEAGKLPDEFYALAMLDATGVCVIPGSGFGQEKGTWHVRSTFLPREELFDDFIDGLRNFHQEFMAKYKDE
ncbi:pyridoxal phosphate-dependent transferase [Piptocephalis cylindrospora]|uniref:Glutamate pyruvate transaminase n=1 Tax=Piptocephalis cylindrospora TaxID=1907219 RepID=A0A4P9Y527_9FUNG|nr:pyridoxal phosphate-dependent transferase [Piptocephalis cylindrospora]|eukprot:RKP13802.1 pyridoxal phosphate-dependent transferase [Piptocephalis cylindrospora]